MKKISKKKKKMKNKIKIIDELTTKLKEYKKNLDSTQEIRNHFDDEVEKNKR